jgi:SAM-dependent methyltransferase
MSILALVKSMVPPPLRKPIARMIGFNHLTWGRQKPVNFRNRMPETISEDVSYAIRVSRSYLDHLEAIGIPLQHSRILELGPGYHFAPNLVLASQGARASVADRFLAPWAPDYHPEFYARFLAEWRSELPAVAQVISTQGYPADALTLHPHPAEDLQSVEDQSQDVVLSNAVLEHVFSIERVCREMARITARGGYNIHQVDFRDHRDFGRPLEFLLMPDAAFRQQFDGCHGECGNRVRSSEVVAAFRNHGFELMGFEVNERAAPDYLDRFLPRLRASESAYKDHASDDLAVLGGRFIFRRL